MDDVVFAHKPRLLDVAAQLKRSAHAALGLAMSVGVTSNNISIIIIIISHMQR